MKTICLYFQVHQPFRLRRYRFFDINHNHYYYDDYLNESVTKRVAYKSYLPANDLLLNLINKHKGNFKVAFSISGTALDQFSIYTPEVIESFQRLAETNCVEFLSETNSHSLSSLNNKEEFVSQVKEHSAKIKKYFKQTPKVFRNTELIYSDQIGADIAEMGFDGVITEGAKQVLGWKSPNFVYFNPINPKLKVLLRNNNLSDDLAFRFSNKEWCEYPLTAEKYANWLAYGQEEIVNIFMDYETFGEHHAEDTGILKFLEALPAQVGKIKGLQFGTPSEIIKQHQPVSPINVPYPISWADEERDTTAWLGNDLQEDAFNSLYAMREQVKKCKDEKILTDWKYLQTSDHLYYMCTKFFSDGAVHSYFNPYDSPYDAYINFMNIISDFNLRVEAAVPQTVTEKEFSKLQKSIEEKEEVIEKYKEEINRLRATKVENNTSTKSTVKSKNTSSTEPTLKKSTTMVTKASGKETPKKVLKPADALKTEKSSKSAKKKVDEKVSTLIKKEAPLKETKSKPAEKAKTKSVSKSANFKKESSSTKEKEKVSTSPSKSTAKKVVSKNVEKKATKKK